MPEMPPIEGAGHLLEYLFEIGPTLAAGGAPGPITHDELRAWQSNTGIALTSWQSRTLHRLSRDYLAEYHQAGKANAPAPWRVPDAVPQVSDTQAALRALSQL